MLQPLSPPDIPLPKHWPRRVRGFPTAQRGPMSCFERLGGCSRAMIGPLQEGRMELVAPDERPWKQALSACLAAAGSPLRLGLGHPQKAQIRPENSESNYSFLAKTRPIRDGLRA